MKYALWLALLAAFGFYELPPPGNETPNPLAPWNKTWAAQQYEAANTAAKSSYHSAWEREFVYVMNLARMHPQLFAKTVVQAYPDSSFNPGLRKLKEYKSLLLELQAQAPLTALVPDSACWASAKCHAASSGKAGYVGHDRQSTACEKLMYLRAECCHYGENTPLAAFLSLIIDEGVPGLGHRRTIFAADYTKVGVSFQPHKTYQTTVVIDFY